MIKKYSELLEGFNTNIKPFSSTSNQFEITYKDGSKVIGYTSGADFPGEPDSPTRGEIFWIEVKTPRQGIGSELFKKALLLMKSYGSKTFNGSVVSASGKMLVEYAIKKGWISEPIKESKTGKKEYGILI